jgi:hypothetical protein
MTTRFFPLLRTLALALAFGVIGSTAGWAQLGGPALSGNGVGPIKSPSGEAAQAKEAPKIAPPPAVPGAISDPSKVIPASKVPTDMNPTDALFDAINRGDIGAARDAVARGADLNGHNVLGMTPMELSIDLSRNDISFMLLSLRGGDSGAAPPAALLAGGKDRAGKNKAGKDNPVHEVRVKAVAPPRVATPPAPRVARLFSGDGGTPVPQSGFLGFDSSKN